MLESYKKSYEDQADMYIDEDWRKMNKNDLVNKYIEVEKDPVLANAYMSAIICRYWNSLNSYYLKSYRSANIEDCYGWLVAAIMRALKHRKWKDPNNKLYNDPNGPDKVINRCIFSNRMGFYQSSNTYKRRRNYGLYSLESLIDDYGDTVNLAESTPLDNSDEVVDIYRLVNSAFDNKSYVTAFIIDCIVNEDLFKRSKKGNRLKFNRKGLITKLSNLTPQYFTRFAATFNRDLSEVIEAGQQCTKLSKGKLETATRQSFKKLRNIYLKAEKEHQSI